MEHASTSELPGYLPVDGHDLHVALTEIDRRLNKLYPGRLGDKALMGYSMGAFQSLYIAATEETNAPVAAPKHGKGGPVAPKSDGGGLIKFDRYVAINTPVR